MVQLRSFCEPLLPPLGALGFRPMTCRTRIIGPQTERRTAETMTEQVKRIAAQPGVRDAMRINAWVAVDGLARSEPGRLVPIRYHRAKP